MFADAFGDVDALVCYAMKANSNQSVLRTLAKLGAGSDVVSGGELKRALAAGFPPEKILFSGVGKTEAELRAALAEDILCINVESEPELELLSRIASEMGRKIARISVRVNPDVEFRLPCQDLDRRAENKFGVPLVARARGVRPRCHLAGHPGDLAPTCISAARLPISAGWKPRSDPARPTPRRRCAPTATPFHISIFGGGLGIPYYMDHVCRWRRRPMPQWSSA